MKIANIEVDARSEPPPVVARDHASHGGIADPAEEFYEWSKMSRACITATNVAFAGATETLLRFGESRSAIDAPHLDATPLRAREWRDGSPVASLMSERRSSQGFCGESTMDFDALSALAVAAVGLTSTVRGPSGEEFARRAAPSAGALYPLDTYVAVARVNELRPNVYLIDPFAERLLDTQVATFGEVVSCFPSESLLEQASAAFLFVYRSTRNRWKYGPRGLRFALLEAGHIVQNMYLVASALGLACRAIGGYYDNELARCLRLDGVEEVPIYAAFVGHEAAAHGEDS